MKRFVAAAALLALALSSALADNYVVKDATGATQTFASKLVGGTNIVYHIITDTSANAVNVTANALQVIMRDAAGNARGANVNASNQLSVSCDNGCAGGTFNNNADGVATSASNGQAAAWGYVWNGSTWDRQRGTTNGIYQIIRDAAGNARGANVDATNRLSVSVDNTPSVNQGGTWTVQPGNTANTTAWLVDARGNVASGASDSGNPVKIGGRFNSTKPALTDGQRGDVQLDSKGNMLSVLFDAAGNARGANVNASNELLVALSSVPSHNVTNAGTFAVQAAQSGNWPVRVQGNAGATMDFAGQNASSPANSLLIGGQFNTSPTTITSGNASPLQLDNAGNLKVNIQSGGGSGGTSSSFGAAFPATGTAIGLTDGTNMRGWAQASNGLNSSGTNLGTAQIVGQFDDTSPTSITENQFGNLRMSANRNLYGTLRDAAGNERGANVNASNQLSVSCDNGCATPADGTATLSGMTALNAATQITLSGQNSVGVLLSGTWTATITPELSIDGGTTWVATQFVNTSTMATAATVAANGTYSIVLAGGASHARVRISAFTSGTVTGNLRATAQDPTGGALLAAANTKLPGSNGGALIGDTNMMIAGTSVDGNSGNKSAQTVRVVIATDQPQLTNKLLVTPDANSAVNVAQVGGNSVSTNNGTAGTGVQRVAIASDNSAVSGMGVGATGSAVPANATYNGLSDGANLRGQLQAANALNSTGTGLGTAQIIGQFDDTSPTAITENQFGNLRMSANRNLYGTIRDAAGNERGANVNASNQLSVSVDNSNVSTNLAQVAGATTLTGNGATGSGSPRVTIANDNSPLQVFGAAGTATTTITRPADTNAYTAGDAWSDSTSAPTSGGFTLSSVCRASGSSGILTDAVVVSTAAPGTTLQGEFRLYDSSVTAINDNAAFAMSDSDAVKYVGKIPFTLAVEETNNSQAHVTGLNIGYTCSGTANLRFIPKVLNAYTPASAEQLTLRVKYQQTN